MRAETKKSIQYHVVLNRLEAGWLKDVVKEKLYRVKDLPAGNRERKCLCAEFIEELERVLLED